MTAGPWRGDEPPREIEVSAPFAEPGTDELVHEAPRHRLRTRLLAVAALVAVVGYAGASTALADYRKAQLRHREQAYDRMTALAAQGQTTVLRAISATRDVVQYAEPELNQPYTSQDSRVTLLHQVADAARTSQGMVQRERAVIAQDRTVGADHHLTTARTAVLTYLDSWAAVFANAGGDGAALSGGSPDLDAQERAVEQALASAAPDPTRAAAAGSVLSGASD